MPAPVAQETAEDADDPLVLERERGQLRQQVDLVQDDRLRTLVEAGAVERELACRSCGSAPRRPPRTQSITCSSSRARSRWARNSCPRPIPSLAPSIRPGMSATVSWRAVRRLDRPEHRRERRERVVGDLRLRVREPAQERRLARVRQPGHRRVGEQLQPQLHLRLVGRLPHLGEPRRLADRRREARVAAAALAAAGEDDARVRTREVGDQLALGAVRLRPDRDRELDRGAVGAVLARAAARLAAAGLELRLRAERGEVAQAGVGDEDDVAAAAAVAAVGPALGHVLLAPEAQASVAAAARQHLDAGAIVEQEAPSSGRSRWTRRPR